MKKCHLPYFLTVLFLFTITALSQAQVDRTEKKLVNWVDENNASALQLLKDIININSGTMNFEGVRAVADVLMPRFDALGMQTEWLDGRSFNRAGHLVAKIEGGKGPKIMLIGHLDTVFEPDSPNQEWRQVDENTIKGPGIADMKGGDVIILQALSALHAQGILKDMNIWVVMTGDEELSGKPLSESKKALIEAAKWADVALGFENGDGNPATVNVARRSSSEWKLTVTGNAAHSSQVFKPEVGAGAIYEASRILYQFYDELASEEFLTFNPGAIVGGTTVTYDDREKSGTAFGKNNVVSKDVTVTGDIRCLTPEQLAKAQATMKRIVSKHLPQTKAIIEFADGYPPFAPTDGNYQLMNAFSKVSQDLGFGEVGAVNPADAGAADISFTSAYISMGIDGMGMSGADDHTINETGDIRALPKQSKRAAVLMYRLMKGIKLEKR
ncbi:M20/M25/M40 family metallo-hydrolase [Roseivirga sp. E12]|uniref:M20/M25/M40 family metallo-hydrolase n=1 Tax=Roseivirga sp. E12 TaxID=2819237 RepID=UPI001ABC78B4|nr:M20/M25/M40 family metallo-hydrolase [Roseivirga sp. E12]MBO3697629.1 M20/M25/M40 family metallo-hydrolase [Roseivirga sp. E12]